MAITLTPPDHILSKAYPLSYRQQRSHYCLVPGVAIPCETLQLPAAGMNVIAEACTFNLPGRAQGMPWAKCDRRGVYMIAGAYIWSPGRKCDHQGVRPSRLKLGNRHYSAPWPLLNKQSLSNSYYNKLYFSKYYTNILLISCKYSLNISQILC